MGKSPNIGLHITPGEDGAKAFKQFRLELAGDSADSNMMIIDSQIGNLNEITQKATVDEIIEFLSIPGNISIDTFEFVDSIDEMTDQTKKYVLSTDGMIYIYGEHSTDIGTEIGFYSTGVEYASSGLDGRVAALEVAMINKVDKDVGKGLSSNDYTTEEKNKLSGIEEGAQKNPEALKNPKALIINGHSYDGSSTLSIAIEASIAVPEYWNTHLVTKASAINVAMEAAGRNKSAFLWYTDSHWPNGNSKMSPILLNYLVRSTAMNKVNFGGDIIGDSLLATRDDMEYLYEWRNAIRELPNHHSVIGNHDNFSSDDVAYEDDAFRYAFLIAPEESSDMVMGSDFCYYIDNPCEKTRYLYLSTGKRAGNPDEYKFVVNSLTSVPSGWHVVAIGHIWFVYNSTQTPTVGVVDTIPQKLLTLFDAYNARGSGTFEGNAYDFTSCGGKVEFCIGGHIHYDYDFRSDGGIPVILTVSDANQVRGGDTYTPGTITEASVCGVIANYTAGKISLIYAGRGTDREILIDPPTVTYTITNTLTHVASSNAAAAIEGGLSYSAALTAEDGYRIDSVTVTMGGTDITAAAYSAGTIHIQNVTGKIVIIAKAVVSTVTPGYTNLADPSSADWLTDKRFSTSSISNTVGGIITNKIPCGVGDIVRAKGLNLDTTIGGSNARIRLYVGDTVADTGSFGFIHLKNQGFASRSGDICTFEMAAEFTGDEGGWTANQSNVDSIRLNGILVSGYTAEDVIITVNEEIT